MTYSHSSILKIDDDGHKVRAEKSRMQRYDDMRRSLLAASGWPAGKAERSRINRQAWEMSASSSKKSGHEEKRGNTFDPTTAKIVKQRGRGYSPENCESIGSIGDWTLFRMESANGWINLKLVAMARKEKANFRLAYNGSRMAHNRDWSVLEEKEKEIADWVVSQIEMTICR